MTFFRFFMTLLWGMMILPATAQSEQALTVSGKVLDAEFKGPLIQATVQLFRANDSTFVGGTVTDRQGNFEVEAPSNGIYRLKVS